MFGSKVSHIVRSRWFLALMAAGAGGVCSCNHKELIFPEGPPEPLEVEFDWQKAPGADPEGMTIYFLPEIIGSRFWRFDISGREGGVVDIPNGRYRMISVNNDQSGITFANTDDYELFSARTVPISGDSVCRPTGMLYAAALSYVRLESHGVRYDAPGMKATVSRNRMIRLTPDSLATVYNIRIDSVAGHERVRTAKVLLQGVAESVNLSTGENSAKSCSVSAALTRTSGEEGKPGIYSVATTAFGTPLTANPAFKLQIIVTTSHGVYSKKFDVTEQVLNSKWLRNVYINISGLEIPSSDPGLPPGSDPDVGIEVGVDGWQLIEITYS